MSESDLPSAPVSAGVPGFIPNGRGVDAGQGWQWIADAFKLFKKQPATWILILIVLVVLAVVSTLILKHVPALQNIVMVVLMQCLMGGIMIGCRALETDEESFEVGHLFAGFDKHAKNLIVLGILAVIISFVLWIPFLLIIGVGGITALIQGDASGVATMGVSLLLAALVTLALMIPFFMALWFAPALIVFNDFTATAALKASFSGCIKNIVPFLVNSVVMFVLMALSIFPLFGLGFIVLIPVMFATVYTAYRDIYYNSASV